MDMFSADTPEVTPVDYSATETNAAVETAMLAELEAMQASKGRASTLVTGGGVTTPAATTSSRLGAG